MRILLAAFVGGIIVFCWGAAAHMVLLKDLEPKPLPGDHVVMESLRGAVTADGLYMFPAWPEGELTEQQTAEWSARYESGPAGLLLYHARGGKISMGKPMAIEFVSNALAAALAAWVVSRMRASYVQRVLAVGVMGLFAWLSLSASYWNWYGFPARYILAEGVEQFVGWALAGLAVAVIAAAPAKAHPLPSE